MIRRRSIVAIVAALSGFAAPALAQDRPFTPAMTCAAAHDLVVQRGAIVLGTGRDLYDRYVSSQGFCQRDEMTKPAWVPTRDARECFIGYRCQRVDDEWPF